MYIRRKIDEMWISKYGKYRRTSGDLIEAYKFMTGKEAISAHMFFKINVESITR